ncbi:SWIM zinc finger family protein [Nannocystis bainbridge]|uniref:SWIM zinc finger family protein n=1 Tax=Nannocystis bainbridge TaxID=2995303 RepID=A0ABT5DX58_9BACT|nr:SWIM zinc finger family protein [Nannocystis bainbridge]MDC0717763.1 SWIM zinc finger family protein [Nannocystis bainbridge]
MSEETKEPESSKPEEQLTDPRTPVRLGYAGASQLEAGESSAKLQIFVNTERPPVRAEGTVKQPLLVREALSAMYEVVSSDFRYVPKDRTAYLAYQRLKKQTAGQSAWQAQQAYFDWLARNDPSAWVVLDPVVTVHPDKLLFEVFSKDEGAYAQMAIDWSAIDRSGELQHGTTNVDYSKALFDGVQRIRSYRETKLSIGVDAVSVASDATRPPVIEKSIQLPDSWLRGFLQVQAAATLPTTAVRIAAIDLYNVLRHLRLNADKKQGGRGVRVELVPGEPPRLVLEPWELVLATSAGPFTGRQPALVRIWGRRRLSLLRRLLPFVETVDIHLLGSGLPSFYVLRAGPVTFTLGLSGFTSANWSQAVGFDQLLPRDRGEEAAAVLSAVLKKLGEVWVASADELAKSTKKPIADVRAALQKACQHGQVMYDLSEDRYRYRPLLGGAIDLSRLVYRNAREKVAHDLVAKGAVKIASENRIYGVGLELTGKVTVTADRRDYRPQLTLDDDGRVRGAECTCAFYRKHKLKEGPCAHLIALRIAQAQEEERRRQARGSERGTITLETRTYARRLPVAAGATGESEEIVQLSLDRQRLRIRWGPRGAAKLRVQSFVFGSVAEARAAFFERVDDLEARGFLDGSAG